MCVCVCVCDLVYYVMTVGFYSLRHLTSAC